MPLSLRGRTARVLASAGLSPHSLISRPRPRSRRPTRSSSSRDRPGSPGPQPVAPVAVVDYEIFTLNYDLLVGFGPNLEPVPGFAESWTQSADGMTWTFKIRAGMKWSDGEPATSEDARWTYQLVLDGVARSAATSAPGYLEPYLTNAGVTTVTARTRTPSSSRPSSRRPC